MNDQQLFAKLLRNRTDLQIKSLYEFVESDGILCSPHIGWTDDMGNP